jgi:endo-alpha-1,4-polygalactosaminidase (GH114 family)
MTLAGCPTTNPPPSAALPPANGMLDYQLGGAYPPAGDVEIVSRDRTASPDPARYNICYVNGFQTQPGEDAMWLTDHPELLLRDSSGAPVIDPEWPDEFILDVSTTQKRADIAAIVGAWIDGCASAGFQAVEIDNLDTYTRFPDSLSEDAAVAMARTFADRAHDAGLAIGQKNAAELIDRRAATTFDFAVVEQCNEFTECDEFVAGYGDQVYVIEYMREPFEAGCEQFPQLSIVLRDVEVAVPGSPTYVRDAC